MREEILQAAVVLKQELPRRSVRQIIEILEDEDKAEKGVLRPSTVSRHLKTMGLMDLEKRPKAKAGYRRFQKDCPIRCGNPILRTASICPRP